MQQTIDAPSAIQPIATPTMRDESELVEISTDEEVEVEVVEPSVVDSNPASTMETDSRI